MMINKNDLQLAFSKSGSHVILFGGSGWNAIGMMKGRLNRHVLDEKLNYEVKIPVKDTVSYLILK